MRSRMMRTRSRSPSPNALHPLSNDSFALSMVMISPITRTPAPTTRPLKTAFKVIFPFPSAHFIPVRHGLDRFGSLFRSPGGKVPGLGLNGLAIWAGGLASRVEFIPSWVSQLDLGVFFQADSLIYVNSIRNETLHQLRSAVSRWFVCSHDLAGFSSIHNQLVLHAAAFIQFAVPPKLSTISPQQFHESWQAHTRATRQQKRIPTLQHSRSRSYPESNRGYRNDEVK